MQLKLQQLDHHLTQSTLAAIYVVHGDEHLLLLEAVDKIRSAARAKGFSERDILHVERGFGWDDLSASRQNRSLFDDRKLIELRIPTGKPGKDGSRVLQEYAQQVAHHCDLLTIITLPRLDRDGLKSAWFSALSANAVTIEVPSVTRAQLPQWIKTRLAAQHQQVDDETLALIAERVEGNLLAADQEIRKLGLLYPPGALDAQQVRSAVLNASRYDIYQLRDALLAQQLARYTRILLELKAQGEALALIVWALADGLRRSLSNETSGARRKFFLRALQKMADIDKNAKGLRVKNSPGDAWDDLLALGLFLQTKH